MKISTLVIFFITICLTSFIILKINEKYSNTKFKISIINIIKILFVSLLNCLSNMFTPIAIRGIASCALIFLLIQIIFKKTWKDNLFYAVIISCTIQLLEMLVALFLPMWIHNIEVLNQSILFKVGFTIVINILLYIILTNRYIVFVLKKLQNFGKNNKLISFIEITIVVVCDAWLFVSSYQTADKNINIILFITEILILTFIIIAIKSKYQNNLSKIKEEQLRQNLDLYTKVASEYKELKHNLMNDLLIIKTKVKKNDQEFINEVINKYKSNYEWVNCITDIPEGLQGLVFLKKNQAELKNITFNLEYNVNKNVEKLFSTNKNFKLYETLGILFDNAIEGAAESNEKVINVVFSCNKTLKIDILNTFNNEINLDRIGDKNYSTKKRGSGIGLNYIKKQKNKFKINQYIRNNIFITEIIINTKEKK